MIVRRCLTLTVSICLILSVDFGTVRAERWSRQVSSSEWIPLANPRAAPAQLEQSNPGTTGLLASGSAQLPQLPQLSLPPALQQQYQEQLLQLQKTQENIQKLLLLQQQLKAQQQLLQSQTFLPSGFSNADEDKQLHQVELGGSQVADLASEDLVPPLPASEALPPVFPPQNFLPQRPRPHPLPKQEPNLPQAFSSLPPHDFKHGQLLQQGQNAGSIGQIEEGHRQGAKQMKESQAPLVPPSESGQDEEEEVQLVYVPAETLMQRGQPKRGRGRKYPLRQHQPHQQHQQHHQPHQAQQPQHPHESHNVDSLHDQDSFARQILQQIQMEREEKAQLLKEERMKEIARLNEEQRALERKNRLQQEALQREQELQRQREAEKKKKELERLEELAKQRELERIREAREKQRLEELERRRLAEIRAKEEKRRAEERQREAERLAALERQKELEIQQALKQQQILEKQRENEARITGPDRPESQHEVQAQALPLIRDQQQQFHRQHLGEKQGKSKIRGRPRQRPNQYQEQQNYREATTTPSPNQPPLSVYMGSSSSKTANAKVSDVLKILKDAKTIAVLDTVGPDTPQVFVGPTSLDPPSGYAKFDLPYLSSIDHNRVERKVDKLPFFVAPLSFDPPPGYSKIPFPAPHIGSVVVNTLDNTDPKESDNPNPSPTPLIEPNSYLDGGANEGPESTTPLYEPQTTVGYSQEPSSTPKYEQSYSVVTPSPGYSGSRFRFKQYFSDNKPASVVGSSYYDDQRPATKKHNNYYDESSRATEIPQQSPRVETSVSHSEEVSYSTTPSYRPESIGPEDATGQLSLINQELPQQRETQRYNSGGQYGQQSSHASTGLGNSFNGEITAGDVNDVRAPVGPTQYSLPAELPAISPHLPGLVNSLLDKNEAKLHTSTTTTTTSTTTTTTTQRTPTTTYRPRSRQRSRIVSTRPRTTTQAPSTRTSADRSRRPHNRSRSRFTTTTEEYRESAYEPTKSRIPETTLRYNVEQRRPNSRTQKYRSRDKTSQQSEVLGHAQSPQSQQSYEGSQGDANSPTSNGFLQPTAPESSGLRQLDSPPNLNDYAQENYPSTTVSTTENYPPLRDVTVNHGSTLVSEDYPRSQNYPQNLQEDPRYRPSYDPANIEQTGLEKSPVNGFNYQAQNEEALDQGIPQRPKDYQLDGKAENSDYEVATTVDPTLRTSEEQRYSPIYDVNAPQAQPEYSLTGQDNLHRLESEKIQTGVSESDPNEQPIFIPLPENKQEDYELPVSSTEMPLSDVTRETTTTSTTPVIIRQRVRGRIGSRLHHEPSVQTRNRGSQDEYVRFNVVNQDSTRSSPSRQRVRSRTRNQNHGSQVQTDGNEYIRFHAVQQQKPIATTTPAPTTTTTTVRPTEEDVDYGFIRPPNFRPVHPVDNRFQAPVTYRPQISEVPHQSLLPNDETAVESSPPQTQLLKNRQKYQLAPNRRLPSRPTTLPPPTTTPEVATTTERIPVATVLPDDAIYTGKPKSRPDDTKQTRVRGRVRRPGRKRVSTTSTTESVLEAHNELPLDENYPRVHAQPAVGTEQQQNLYDDNYDGGFSGGARNPTGHQFYETSSENYPAEFILNFGNYPAQPVQREEYDQTQLASNAPRKYTQSSRLRPSPEDDHSTTADIYGAESQWSTKLTRTSFQPSFAVNRVPADASKGHGFFHESLRDANAPEIITAAPEVSSVTLVVSSDDRRDKKLRDSQNEEEDESMLMGTTIFGKKTTVHDHTEKMDTNGATTEASTVTKERIGSEMEASQDGDSWMMDRVENSTEQQNIDLEKTVKKSDNPPIGKKTGRRRRVRVRVRPAVDDFVTAESQHFNSALNGLFRDQYKYNPVRESKLPAVASSSPEKSVLQDFLTEILKSDEPAKTTTTEVPETAWTMSPAMTTPMTIPDDVAETTEIQITTIPTTEKPEETTTVKSSSFEDVFSKLVEEDDSVKAGEKEKVEKRINDEEKKQENWELSKKWNQKNLQTALNFESMNEKYAGHDNDVNKVDDSEAFGKNSEEESSNGKSEPKSQKDNVEAHSETNEEATPKDPEDSGDYPKNHRTKWSEVRYPLTFDGAPSWNYDPSKASKKSTTAIPGLVTKNEGDTSVRTLSDYVQAIFDSMKSAEEEETTLPETQNPNEVTTTVEPPLSDTELPIQDNFEQEKLAAKDNEIRATTQSSFEEQTIANPDENIGGSENEKAKQVAETTEATTLIDLENATTLGRIDTTSDTTASSSPENLTTEPPLTTTPKPSSTTSPSNSTESILGKVLRTSTTTKVSHMTEICYRGRCVMTRPTRDDRFR